MEAVVTARTPRGFEGRLERRYQRVGARYVYELMAMAGVWCLLMAAISSVGAAYTLELSRSDFWMLLALAEGGLLIAVVIAAVVVLRWARPMTRWVSGDRSQSTAVAAMPVALDIPVRGMQAVAALFAPFAVVWCVVAADRAETGIASVPILLVAPGVVALSVGAINAFAGQLGMRPVLREISVYLGVDMAVRDSRLGLAEQLIARLAAVGMMMALVGVIVGLISDDPLSRFLLVFTVGPAVLAALGAVVFPFVALSLLGPVNDLIAASRRVAAGDLTTKVDVVTGDELGELSRSFNTMVAQLRTHDDELRASRARIVAATDAERRRVERNIHDGAQQRLVGVAIDLSTLEDTARDQGSDDLEAMAITARRNLREALDELRELARGLHPSVLASDGLLPALEHLATRSPVPVTVRAAEDRYPELVESTAYFVASEALANIAKHANASHALVTVQRDHAWLVIAIADDGVGGASGTDGSGLEGLSDRVAAIGGSLLIDSAPGQGTRVTARMPMQDP